MKVYLDTNILYAYLKKRLENRISKGEDSNSNFIFPAEITPLTSFFAFGEIVEILKREMKISRNALQEFLNEEIEKLSLKTIKTISIDEEILKWCFNGLELKDAIHLAIAKQYKLVIITNDKKLLNFSKAVGIDSLKLKNLKNLSLKKQIFLSAGVA